MAWGGPGWPCRRSPWTKSFFLAHHLSPVDDPLTAGAVANPDSVELRRLVNADSRLLALVAESQRELQSLIAALQL